MTNRPSEAPTLWRRLRRRGVVRVALGYLVIAWLVLQVGDVVLDPLGAPPWVMRLLIVLAAVGFPIALALAWFLELTPTGVEVDNLDEAATRPAVGGLRRYADVVIIGALVVAVLLLLARQEELIPQEPVVPVIAVLPFDELESREDHHFGDGFADTLIHKLGMLDQLTVLTSSSSFEFRGGKLAITDVASKLGASVLLQGSIRRAGGLLRLEASLVDGSSGQRLWSESYRRPIDDVFRLQDEIANAVATAVGVQLTPAQVERIARPPTTSVAAYDTFLRASREALESRDAKRLPEALQYLHDAIELDPQFALAHATLVEAMHLTASYRFWDTKWADFADEARAAAARAQELDPQLGEGYLAEAFVAEWERDTGIRDHSDQHLIALTEKALQLSPSNPVALKMLGSLVEDRERRLELLVRAARIDPRSGIVRVNVAEWYEASGDYDQAEQWLIAAATATDPYFSIAYKLLVEMNVWEAGRIDRAARWGRAFEAAHPQDWASNLAYARSLFELGAWDEARELLGRTLRLAEAGDEEMAWAHDHKAQWLAYVDGDTDTAVDIAERYIRENLLVTPDWPDLSGQPSTLLRSFELLALVDLSRGNARAALDRYFDARLDPANMSWSYFDGPAIPQAVMFAVLHRYTDQPQEADRLLRDVLARVADVPVTGRRGKGFVEFVAHSFLGETDAAIEALRVAMNEGWLPGWWSLKFGAFDENYAAVLQDPRFERLYDQLLARATEMRESFRANPDLPRDLLLESGLSSARAER